MKKTVAISLSILYFLLTTGIAVSVHYCGGNVKDVSVFTSAIECCCGGEGINNGCCENDEYLFKIDPDQRLLDVNQKFLSKSNIVFLFTLINQDYKAKEIESTDYSYTNLPPPKNEDLWLIYSSFIFYG